MIKFLSPDFYYGFAMALLFVAIALTLAREDEITEWDFRQRRKLRRLKHRIILKIIAIGDAAFGSPELRQEKEGGT